VVLAALGLSAPVPYLTHGPPPVPGPVRANSTRDPAQCPPPRQILR
jgi:hypothetical protein